MKTSNERNPAMKINELPSTNNLWTHPADGGMLKESNSYVSADTLPDLTTAAVACREDVISEPTDTDVLLGRGVSTNRHPGNVNFRGIVGEHVVS